MKSRILIVDDEVAVRYSFERVFGREYHVQTAENGLEALQKVKADPPDLILLDIRMPVLNGLETLKRLRQDYPALPVIVMTAFADTETAIEAIKEGAFEYVTKPFENEELRRLIEKAIAYKRFLTENLTPGCEGASDFEEKIIGKSPPILQVCKLVGQVAHTRIPILITGESGVGKELVARAIHRYSDRKNKPFIVVNCATLPESLFESELFGYEPGAFTGAEKRRIGKFEQCNGGTLFLDEIGEMSPSTQAKLLRVLQDSTIERLGGNQPIKVDVRIIAATNKNLSNEVASGRFRLDLYHRLNVFPINIPPLRERKDDIPELVNYFIKKANREVGRNIGGIEPEAMDLLLKHSWPGNVRELQNTIRRAVLLAKGDFLTKEDLILDYEKRACVNFNEAITLIVETFLLSGEEKPFDRLISEMERAIIRKALDLTRGNQVQAAKLLGISRNTLRKKLEE